METTKQSEGIEGDKYPFTLQVVPIDFDNTTSCVIEPLDPTVLEGEGTKALHGNQKLIFDAVSELIGECLDDNGAAPIQRVYDVAVDAMPPPVGSQRDRRPEAMRRALAGLHEKGYITIAADIVTIGSTIDE